LQDEGKFSEVNDRLRTAAGLTNWSYEAMGGVIQYYMDRMHNPDAAIAFVEARVKIDPKDDKMLYGLAALHASVGHNDDAIKYLGQAAAFGGTNALISARIDPRFAGLVSDPRFQDLMKALATTNSPATNAPVAPKAQPAKN